MPVKWVLHWQPNAGSTVNSQILTEVSQCVESISGSKGGRWKSILTHYRPLLRDQNAPAEYPRDFLGLSLQEQPDKYYFIVRGQRIVLEADSAIQMVMEKLQSYKSRVSLNFEGIQYQLGDFQLRVGKVVPFHSESFRGIVMEVEYLPISSLEKSRQILEEFVDILQETVAKKSLPGHFMHIEPNFSEYGLSDHYSSQHTAVQYATVTAQDNVGEIKPGSKHQAFQAGICVESVNLRSVRTTAAKRSSWSLMTTADDKIWHGLDCTEGLGFRVKGNNRKTTIMVPNHRSGR